MSQTREKLEEMGFRILDAVRTELILSMRFMAPALNSLGFKMDLATSFAGTDAAYIRFNPGFLLQTYVERPRKMNRMYVHMLVHCLFRHMYSVKEREDPELWDLSCDIAAESVVDSMTYDVIARSHSSFREYWYEKLEQEVRILTAEKIYARFMENDRDYSVEEALEAAIGGSEKLRFSANASVGRSVFCGCFANGITDGRKFRKFVERRVRKIFSAGRGSVVLSCDGRVRYFRRRVAAQRFSI